MGSGAVAGGSISATYGSLGLVGGFGGMSIGAAPLVTAGGALSGTIAAIQDRDATAIASLVLSPDGETLAQRTNNGQIQLYPWELETGRLKRTLTEHQDTIFSLTWTKDGKTLASGSADGTIRIGKLDSYQYPILLVVWSGWGAWDCQKVDLTRQFYCTNLSPHPGHTSGPSPPLRAFSIPESKPYLTLFVNCQLLIVRWKFFCKDSMLQKLVFENEFMLNNQKRGIWGKIRGLADRAFRSSKILISTMRGNNGNTGSKKIDQH